MGHRRIARRRALHRRPRRPPGGRRRTLQLVRTYTDSLQHAAIAAAVAAPLVPRAGRAPVLTAAVAAVAIDVDHAVAARSVRVAAVTGLSARPRTHSLVTALGTGAAVAAAAGPLHGWATFAGLASHLLHDAGDDAAPTPVLWPLAPARQLGRRRQAAGTAALLLGSIAVSASAGSSRASTACADGGGASARPRTA